MAKHCNRKAEGRRGDTSETFAVPFDKDWNKENTSVNTQAGQRDPLPGTVVDLSGPRSDFFQQIELLQNHKPARYKSLLDLTNTTSSVNKSNVRLFNYTRNWVSLGDKKPEDVYDMVHERDFVRQFPRVHKETSEAECSRIKMFYHKMNQDKAFRLMQATKDCEPRLLLAPTADDGILNTPKSIKTELGRNPNNRKNGLVHIMNIPEIFDNVVDYIEPSVADLTSLAMACKDTARLISGRFAVWDFSSGNFHLDKGYRNDKGGIRRNTLIITPITQVAAASPQDKPFEQEFKLLTKMVRKICISLTSFRDLMLDQIPYLNTKLVRLMIKSMPNLESITITRCKQLDFTKLDSLLRIIEEKNGLAATRRHKRVRLDFYPYFFEGPTSAPNTLGSFGLTYHKPTFDVPKAVFARIMACWDLAATLGVDLLSDSSGIWHFIRRLPGPDPFWAYKAREAVFTWERYRICCYRTFDADRKLNRHLWKELGAAVCGDTAENISREPKERECSGCYTLLPDYFFSNTKNLVCWGCRMGAFVANHEDSHFRDRTNRVMQIWLGNRKRWLVQELSYLPNDKDEERDALRMAKLTDKAWRYEFFEFKPGVPRFPQAIHWETHLSSTKRTRELLWPLTGRTNHRDGGPQYENAYLEAGLNPMWDERTKKRYRDIDTANCRDFFGIYVSDLHALPDWEPYNRNWEARERGKADLERKPSAYLGNW
ncbi:hypothetical protein QR685DRAFT_28332 [Neurospora intermedia]|uniref:F-box domain-containing protein n=1 Tax=Neurospora intermedia TaxID=5142 RepID=A0ABR3DQM6_NEUIN